MRSLRALVALLAAAAAHALPHQPAVSRTHVAFVEAGQLWIAPRAGGVARRLTTTPGAKFTPRFSPDGKSIAFSSNEAQSEVNLFTMPVSGGAPKRVTFLPSHQSLTQWTADGRLLFHTNSLSFIRYEMRLFRVTPDGGLPEPLPIAYGADGAIDASGRWLAYTPQWPHTLIEYWKRYRGGAAPDLWLVDLQTNTSKKITDWIGSDLQPMWQGETLYYLSDAGPEQRRNIWSYDMKSATHRQITRFAERDVRNPSIGGDAIVFELGAGLQLLDLRSGKSAPLDIALPANERPALIVDVDASRFITSRQVSNDGKTILLEARGDLWILGESPRNLTATSGVFEREAALSSDGTRVAYWSDETGEYQLYIREIEHTKAVAAATALQNGFRFRPIWSPDSRRLAFADASSPIYVYDLGQKRLIRVDAEPQNDVTELAWSADSRWLAYTKTATNQLTAIWRYDVESGERVQLTAEVFNGGTPVFDARGARMFFLSYRDFNNGANDWIQQRITHRATGIVMSVPLRDTAFNAQSFESRATRLGTASGSFNALAATPDGVVIYAITDLAGKSSIRTFDPKTSKDEIVAEGVSSFTASPDGTRILFERKGELIVREIAGGAESVRSAKGMSVKIDLRREWQQIFDDAWRFYRDFFYAPQSQHADWQAVRDEYRPRIARCLTRQEVNLVLGEMIGESSTGHAYIANGGDVSTAPSPGTVAMFGADLTLDREGFRIARIYEGAPWDDTVRSPLREAKEGEYLLAINGVPLDTNRDPRAALLGTAGKPVTVTVGPPARDIVITPVANESDLRRRHWIESNRRRVDAASGGRIGYVHIPEFTVRGFNDLARQFYGQIDKDALIIDARWSMGGSIGATVAELLARVPLNYLAGRYTDRELPVPRFGAHFGPKALLVHHITVSAGENFAYYFRKLALGPIVGARTWGGLTGLNPVPALIDGGYVNVPNAPFFDQSGWLIEGHGLEPDVVVPHDPERQLDTAIEELLRRLPAP